VLLIVIVGLANIGLPQNPTDATALLATQVADPSNGLEPKDRLALQRDLIEYTIDSRTRSWTLLAQIVGAVVLALGGFFTWRNLRVAQEGQITNRFTQAIGQLGAIEDDKPNLVVRLGGIYALERIARDSERDFPAIVRVLDAYLEDMRSDSPTDLVRIDALAVKAVLGRLTGEGDVGQFL